jgi:DNA-binding response OmpR family regulator
MSAQDGRGALEVAGKQKPDLVMLDVKMPKATGFEVCESLQGNDPEHCPPVILISGQADAGTRLQGLDKGADDFTKPFSPKELLAKMDRIFKGARTASTCPTSAWSSSARSNVASRSWRRSTTSSSGSSTARTR